MADKSAPCSLTSKEIGEKLRLKTEKVNLALSRVREGEILSRLDPPLIWLHPGQSDPIRPMAKVFSGGCSREETIPLVQRRSLLSLFSPDPLMRLSKCKKAKPMFGLGATVAFLKRPRLMHLFFRS